MPTRSAVSFGLQELVYPACPETRGELFCGLSAALALVKRGVTVALLDAETFGSGASCQVRGGISHIPICEVKPAYAMVGTAEWWSSPKPFQMKV